MPRKSPFLLNLTVAQRRELEEELGAIRCRIVTWSALDCPFGRQRHGQRRDRCSPRHPSGGRLEMAKTLLRARPCRARPAPRGGGPPAFPPEVVVAAKALACELPARLGVPLSRLHIPDIASEVISRGIVAEMSGTTVWRWLSNDAIKPWRHRSWICPGTPISRLKQAGCSTVRGGVERQGPRRRRRRGLRGRENLDSGSRPPPPEPRSRPRARRQAGARVRPGGALQYFAAWDVHRAKIFGRCEEKTGIEPFGRLVGQVMGAEPYFSARRVFWVVDNGSSHRGKPLASGLLPVGRTPSWSNCPFTPPGSTRSRSTTPSSSEQSYSERLCRPCRSRAALGAFERCDEQSAAPFEWKFTRNDLALLMKKLADKPDYQVAA